jgi:uncharacterized membrane protein
MQAAFRRMALGWRGRRPENGCFDTLFRRAAMSFTPVILIHLATALAAVIVGATMLMFRKGTPLHRISGRVWLLLMAITALASFGIRHNGSFSWIHLLSLMTLYSLFQAVRSIRGRDIVSHRRFVTGAYAGLVIAGLFTLAPGRRLGYLVWHAFHLV